MNPWEYEFAQMRLNELYRASQAARDARLAHLRPPGRAGQFLSKFGDLLIVCGVKLKARYQAPGSPAHQLIILDLG